MRLVRLSVFDGNNAECLDAVHARGGAVGVDQVSLRICNDDALGQLGQRGKEGGISVRHHVG